MAFRRGREEAGAAQNPFWGKGLGHRYGFLASSGQHQLYKVNTMLVPWGVDIVQDWEVSKSSSLTLPSETCELHNVFFCLIQQSGVVCEFYSSCANVFLNLRASGLASSESQPPGKTHSLN